MLFFVLYFFADSLKDGPNSRQTVRIPTQRLLTVLWVHHWQRFLSTQLQTIPANMIEQLALNKPQRKSIRKVAYAAVEYLLLLDIGPSNALD